MFVFPSFKILKQSLLGVSSEPTNELQPINQLFLTSCICILIRIHSQFDFFFFRFHENLTHIGVKTPTLRCLRTVSALVVDSFDVGKSRCFASGAHFLLLCTRRTYSRNHLFIFDPSKLVIIACNEDYGLSEPLWGSNGV